MQYKIKTFKNGLRAVVVPLKDTEIATVMVLVHAGSNYEDKRINGISHFLEHMCFKGTEKRSTSKMISTELDSMGAVSNAFTGNELTGYWAKGHVDNVSKIIEVVSDIYLNSTFPKEEIEKERGVIIEEINMYEDLPQRKVSEIFEELLYGDQPAGRSILGPKENIKKISREDFVEYRNKYYKSGNTVVIVAGKVNEMKVLNQIERQFKNMKKGSGPKIGDVKEKQTSPKVKIFNKKTDQSHLVLGFRAFSFRDKRKITFSLLNTILGQGMSSRLFEKMRNELGICYYVRSNEELYSNHGAIAISAGVANDRIKEAVKGIVDEIKKLICDGVSEDELEKAKNYSIGRLYIGLETSDGWADYYGEKEFFKLKIKTPSEVEKEIRKVTVNDIQKLAREIFVEKSMNLAIVGPFESSKDFLPLLSLDKKSN